MPTLLVPRLYIGGHFDGQTLDVDEECRHPHAKRIDTPLAHADRPFEIAPSETCARIEHYEPCNFWRKASWGGIDHELVFALSTLSDPERLALWRKHRGIPDQPNSTLVT